MVACPGLFAPALPFLSKEGIISKLQRRARQSPDARALAPHEWHQRTPCVALPPRCFTPTSLERFTPAATSQETTTGEQRRRQRPRAVACSSRSSGGRCLRRAGTGRDPQLSTARSCSTPPPRAQSARRASERFTLLEKAATPDEMTATEDTPLPDRTGQPRRQATPPSPSATTETTSAARRQANIPARLEPEAKLQAPPPAHVVALQAIVAAKRRVRDRSTCNSHASALPFPYLGGRRTEPAGGRNYTRADAARLLNKMRFAASGVEQHTSSRSLHLQQAHPVSGIWRQVSNRSALTQFVLPTPAISLAACTSNRECELSSNARGHISRTDSASPRSRRLIQMRLAFHCSCGMERSRPRACTERSLAGQDASTSTLPPWKDRVHAHWRDASGSESPLQRGNRGKLAWMHINGASTSTTSTWLPWKDLSHTSSQINLAKQKKTSWSPSTDHCESSSGQTVHSLCAPSHAAAFSTRTHEHCYGAR